VLDKLKSHLSGGHFRFLNESLYTTTGDAAFSTFSSQPELFDQVPLVSSISIVDPWVGLICKYGCANMKANVSTVQY
jgi:hypothetical protein